MDISGSYTLNAPREQVWDALLDPDTLKRAVPGCQSLERTSGTEYTARIAVEVAGIRGIYDGALKVVDPQRPESLRLVVDGAGARGILHGDGVLRLETAATGATLITYSGQAQLGGTIASIGMGVAGHEATRLITDFFSRLASTLPAYTPAVTAPTAATPDMVSTATAAPMSAPMDALQRTAPITPAPPPQPAPAEAMAAPATGSPPASEPPMAAPMPASAASPASPAMSATSSPAPTPAVTAARPAGILDIDSGQRAARTIWGALIVVIVVAAIIILYIVTR